MSTLHFIINPCAKNGYSLKVWNKIERTLKIQHILYTASFTGYKSHGTEIAKELATFSHEQIVYIVVVGGDGTFSEVARGLIGLQHVRLGFIPAGSGNDFARGMKLPKNPLHALHVLLRRHKQAVSLLDIGFARVDNMQLSFVNNLGAGFDGLISKKVNQSKLKRCFNKLSLGGLAYAFFVIKEVLTYETTDITLTVDGEIYVFKDTWFVTVANHPYYGGGMMIAPGAKPDDGQMDIIVVQQLTRVKLLAVFISVFWGGHVTFKEVKRLSGQNVIIHSDKDIAVHIDGDFVGMTPVEIDVYPQSLSIVARVDPSQGALKELKKA